AAAQNLGAEAGHVLDIDSGDVDAVQRENLGKAFGRAMRVDDRDRAATGEPFGDRAAACGRVRVGQRLVQRVAAADVVKGLDAQRHAPRYYTLRRDARRLASSWR